MSPHRTLDLAHVIWKSGVDESDWLLHEDIFVKQVVRNAVCTSIWFRTTLTCAVMIKMMRISKNLATGTNVSSKIIPYFCRKYFAAIRSLFSSIIASIVFLHLEYTLTADNLRPCEIRSSSHIPSSRRDSIRSHMLLPTFLRHWITLPTRMKLAHIYMATRRERVPLIVISP